MPVMTLGEHLEELRRRLIHALAGLVVAMGLSLVFARRIIAWLKAPYDRVMIAQGLAPELAVITLTAGIATYLKVALISGLVLASPWIFYQLWAFVGAGLYRHERRYVLMAVPFSAALFIGGALFFLLVAADFTVGFLIGFSRWMDLKPVITLENHIGFKTSLMFIFGLCFQTPLLILVLARVGAVTVRQLNHYRRHVIVVILIIAALATSPSPVDQVALAVPMYLLFELGVVLAYLAARKKVPTGD
jgi:sec-independent protein translocase protein TatC